jgi:hypothetical protein
VSKEANRFKVIQEVLAMINEDSRMVSPDKLHQGQLVATGFVMPNNPLSRVGYVTQIRKGVGQFGSDLVFLRLATGGLMTHENQGFWLLSEEQEALARSVFEDLPENEDYAHGYLCVNKVHEVGFIIEQSKSTPAPISGNLNITVKYGDQTDLIRIV